LFWTAKRYRAFLERNRNQNELSFRRKFWRNYPFRGLEELAKRVNVLGGGGVNWELLTSLPSESVVQQISDHLERLAKDVPPNVPF
jgi:hypothetical protein